MMIQGLELGLGRINQALGALDIMLFVRQTAQ